MPGDSDRISTATAFDPETATVDRLLDTAANLFWKKGYAATSTREIADVLQMRQASLYYHMASKEELLYAICISSLREILYVPAAVAKTDVPRERVAELIRAHTSSLLQFQMRNATMLTELRSLSPRHRIEVLALREQYGSFVRSTLEAAQASGAIRTDVPAGYLGLALLNMLNWAALWYRPDHDVSPDRLSEIFNRVYLEGAASTGARALRPLALPDFEARIKKPRARKALKPTEYPTVDRLQDAAVAVFSRKGYTASSTREVAAVLGIQKASLYYHIESKEDLLYLVCKSSLEQIHSDVEAATKNVADPLERIQTLISTHIESMLRDRDKHATTLAEMHALSAERLAHVLKLRHGYEDLVRSILRDAQVAGVVRGDMDAQHLCLIVLGLMNRVLVWYRRRGRLSPSQLGQLLGVLFLTGAAARPK